MNDLTQEQKAKAYDEMLKTREEKYKLEKFTPDPESSYVSLIAKHMHSLTDLDFKLDDLGTIDRFVSGSKDKTTPTLYYQGPLTDAQFMALQKLHDADLIDLDIKPRQPATEQTVIIHSFNPAVLHNLALAEPKRRAEGPQVAKLLQDLCDKAGIAAAWEWDGMRAVSKQPLHSYESKTAAVFGPLGKSGALKMNAQLTDVAGNDLHPEYSYVSQFDLAKLIDGIAMLPLSSKIDATYAHLKANVAEVGEGIKL